MSTTSEAFAPVHTGRNFDTVDQLEAALRGEKYIADRSLATTLFLTLRLRKPLRDQAAVILRAAEDLGAVTLDDEGEFHGRCSRQG